jgi:uncharacterized flavoprotein (TIGR03862 family)
LLAAIEAFPPRALREWSATLGQETFVGSSGRVFPRSFKASPLLRAWLRRLNERGVAFRLRHKWTGWNPDGSLTFEAAEGSTYLTAKATVLALGGASWPRLGSDGGWVDVIHNAGIGVTPLRPANCGFTCAWSELFRERFAGQPVKRIALSHEGFSARGEMIVTEAGLEGGAIYALSRALRSTIECEAHAELMVDLRPDVSDDTLAHALDTSRGKQSLSNHLRKTVKLAPVAIALLHEAARQQNLRLAHMNSATLARFIKAVPLRLTGISLIERAISTAGGVPFEEIDGRFMLKRRPGVFVAGEMLDWEAPTGGYLLQGCFATGAAAGHGALAWLARR